MAGAAVGSLAFDEFGRPFLILRDQDNQKRLIGKDAIKVEIYRNIVIMFNIPILGRGYHSPFKFKYLTRNYDF